MCQSLLTGHPHHIMWSRVTSRPHWHRAIRFTMCLLCFSRPFPHIWGLSEVCSCSQEDNNHKPITCLHRQPTARALRPGCQTYGLWGQNRPNGGSNSAPWLCKLLLHVYFVETQNYDTVVLCFLSFLHFSFLLFSFVCSFCRSSFICSIPSLFFPFFLLFLLWSFLWFLLLYDCTGPVWAQTGLYVGQTTRCSVVLLLSMFDRRSQEKSHKSVTEVQISPKMESFKWAINI